MANLDRQNRKIPQRAFDTAYMVILAGLFAGFVMLFYRQCIRFNGGYISDTFVYAQDRGNLVHSRMMAFILPKLHELTGGYYATAVFLALIVIATILASYMFISYMLQRENVTVDRWMIQAMSFAGLVATAIYLPGVYEHFYQFTWSRYSWQSPTQQAMILFSILSFLMFIKIYDHYMERMKFSQWLGLTVLLFLTAWAKPNFMMVMSPVAIVIFIADFFRKREFSIGRRIKSIIALGMAFIPAGVFILILNHLEYDGGDNGAIAICPGFFLEEITNVPVMIFLSLAFPLVVFIFNYRKLKDYAYQIIAGITVAGIGEYMLLVETGKRIFHGNFSWGREVAEYILFLAAIVLALMNLKDKSFLAGKPVLRKIYFIVISLLLAGHVISGLIYLQYVARGHLYRM